MSNTSKGTAAVTAFIQYARLRFGWLLVAREVNLRGGAVSILGDVLEEGLDAIFIAPKNDGGYHLVEVSVESKLAAKKRRVEEAVRKIPSLEVWSGMWVVTYKDGWNPKGNKAPGWRMHNYISKRQDPNWPAAEIRPSWRELSWREP